MVHDENVNFNREENLQVQIIDLHKVPNPDDIEYTVKKIAGKEYDAEKNETKY